LVFLQACSSSAASHGGIIMCAFKKKQQGLSACLPAWLAPASLYFAGAGGPVCNMLHSLQAAVEAGSHTQH
jgi:hypothetical protein